MKNNKDNITKENIVIRDGVFETQRPEWEPKIIQNEYKPLKEFKHE